ncbi:Type I Modular PKS [Gnomoniopsis sp. IMI 355080]|nr:Type I Modular PKS [Gnomoniopsis sp. IMI 355080]
MTSILSVADLLKQHAAIRGNQIAFSGPAGRNVTYADLLARTARVAGHLMRADISRGHRVALVLSSCIEAVECTFAITRAAAIAVPLDARSSHAELTRALKSSRAHVIITDDRRLGNVCEAVKTVKECDKAQVLVVVVGSRLDLNVDVEGLIVQRYEDWAQTTPNPEELAPPIDDLGLEEPAWLHYTTGTTGQPKGVLSTQRAWIWTAVNSYVPSLKMTSTDKLFWPLPLFHAFGHSLCIIGTLVTGASTHLVGSESLLDNLVQHPETTIIAGAPATYREITTNSANRKELSRLRPRACVSAGSAAPAGLSAQVEQLFGIPIINHYGCTECGMIATTNPGDTYGEDSCGTSPHGIDVQVRLLTPDGQMLFEAMNGEEGEICVRTPSFMLGYDNDMTQVSKTADGWYRTGDLGRLTKTGTDQAVLTVTGRLKELIIRGGENIHPGEVERPLRTCPGVDDVVVTGLPHDMLGEVPTAFIVPKPGVDIDASTLLAACRAMLPDYKVPVTFYTIDSIPHTASGKPKRLATVELLRTGAHCRPLTARLLTEDLVEPLVLAESAAACTGGPRLDELDPDQSFMTLGLSSLTSVVLRDRLASLTGLNLPVTHQVAVPKAPDESDAMEPIAIISMDCRYPGGISSPEDLWHVVSQELDVTSDFPTNREWDIDALYDPDPNKTGTCVARRGGFLHDMADFDAGFFGMSPREALATDPQQRLLLETTHSLIERASIAPSSLRGSKTGVFVGMIYSDYASRFNHGSGKGHESEAHLDIGSSPSVAAGRISYSFDFKGPSMAIDAACSSSLTAIHLAAASLQTRESRLAVAGGVTLMSTPRQFIAFSRQRGLSTDGRCRSYSSDANGTGWSEGVGLVLLERLSDAKRNGHRILGLVRGSAVNSDGTSNGLTAPSGPAQQEVIRQALSRAALTPADVDVLDGHGTATSLGDPIEVHAILKAYASRPVPLLLGSVKSNIGHTQAAAGVASVIKMVQSMQHGIAPASLHITKPSPHIDWTSGAVELLTKARTWPRAPGDRPRRAAVSSFGISGTNAHVILEHFEDKHVQEERPLVTKSSNSFPWLLSGADEAALRAQARQMAALCHRTDALDVAFSLATTRSALSHRAAVTAASDDLPEAMLALAEGRSHLDVSMGLAKANRAGRSQHQARLAFLFSGQGSQRLGMGQGLCARFARFEAAFREVCDVLDPHLERPLSEVISSTELLLLNRANFAQAAVFAFEVAMYRLLESFGIRPDYVAGHSLGEISAAHVAGILSLEDAATLVVARGSLMAALPEGGAMASISATKDEVENVLRDMDVVATTSVAAVNARDSVVVSGPMNTVLAVKDVFTAQGRPTTQLRVSHAFHSPMMQPVLNSLGEAIRHFSPSPNTERPTIPLVSTVTGKLVKPSDMTAEYWLRHVTAPVHFADAVHTLSTSAGVATFVEIGPSAPLGNYVPDSIATSGSKYDEVNILLKALGLLWVRGIQPSSTDGSQAWAAVFGGSGARVVDLPVYPFQRRRYWLESPPRELPVSNTGHATLTHAPVLPSTPPNEIAKASPSTPPHEADIDDCLLNNQLNSPIGKHRRAALLRLVQDEVAVVLGFQDSGSMPASAWDTPLTDLGFDSVLGILLRNRLGKQIGVTLPGNLIFNEATGTALALVDFLSNRMDHT